MAVATVTFSKSPELARLDVLVEMWGMSFEVEDGEELRCTLDCDDPPSWHVVTSGAFLSAYPNGSNGTVEVHKRAGKGEWQLVFEGDV